MFENLKKYFKGRSSDKKIEKIRNTLLITYCIILLLFLLVYRIQLLPDQMLFFGIVGAFFIGRTKKFVRAWFPLVILLFAYEAMRGIADNLGGAVHYFELIYLEKFLFFGTLPTVFLQDLLHTSGVLLWYDYLSVFIYSQHFFIPLIFAYFLWLKQEDLFHKFTGILILTSYLALITYLIFPAAPPWLAGINGYIPPVQQILFELDGFHPVFGLKTLYVLVNANPVAAIPSLHIAYPFLIFLFCWKYFGRKTFPVVIYPLAMTFATVYLGEHYIIDGILGIIYVLAVFWFLEQFIFKEKGKESNLKSDCVKRK